MNNEKTLTLKEALAQGYTKYVYPSDGFQALNDLKSLNAESIENGVELVEKDSFSPSGMEAKDILGQIAEQIYCQHADDTGDDTDDVYEKLMTIDTSCIEPFVNAINEKLSTMNFYRSSGIKIIKG